MKHELVRRTRNGFLDLEGAGISKVPVTMLHEEMSMYRKQSSKEIWNEFSGKRNIMFQGLERKSTANY